MRSRPSRETRVERQRRAQVRRRVRRTLGAAFLAVILVVTLILTAFGSSQHPITRASAPAPATRLLPAGPPSPQVIAVRDPLRIQLPLPQERVTAIGYHASGEGALPLHALGSKANRGFVSRTWHRIFGGGGTRGLRYFELGGSGSPNSALDVGAPAGTDVYAPVDGTVVGLSDFIINGRKYGARIDIEPLANPAVVLTVTQLSPDRALSVGSKVSASTTKIGSVIDLSGVERQALAAHTQDAGNHVSIEVRRAATLSIP